MEILGKDFIAFKKLFYIEDKKELKDGVLFEYDETLIKLANENNFEFSVIVKNNLQAIFANAAKAKYIILDKDFLEIRKIVKLAQFYLFDAKISLLCANEEDFKQAINYKVDCAIFDKGIIWK